MVNYLSTSKKPFSIKITGIVETLKKLDKFDKYVKKDIDEMVSDIADDYYEEIFNTAPVDTKRYRSNWFKKRIKKGQYLLYNSYANVISPRGEHYGDYLVYGLDRFAGIAVKAKYRYGNPATGALHDLALLNFEMTRRVVKPKVKNFMVKHAGDKANLTTVTVI